MLGDWQQQPRQDHGCHFWLLPEWNGVLLGDTDFERKATFGAEKKAVDRPRLLALHQGPDEESACRIIQSGSWNFVFANGYTLKKRFRDVALQNGYSIFAFWLEADLGLRQERADGRPFPKRFRADAHEQEQLARQLEARLIDANQPLELVVADIWEQLLWEWAPPHLQAELEGPESLIIPAADRS